MTSKFRYLAKSTTWNQFLLIAYIVFLTKLQKRQIPENGFALIEKTISQVLNQSQNLEYIADIGSFAEPVFSWRYNRFRTRFHHPYIWYRL